MRTILESVVRVLSLGTDGQPRERARQISLVNNSPVPLHGHRPLSGLLAARRPRVLPGTAARQCGFMACYCRPAHEPGRHLPRGPQHGAPCRSHPFLVVTYFIGAGSGVHLFYFPIARGSACSPPRAGRASRSRSASPPSSSSSVTSSSRRKPRRSPFRSRHCPWCSRAARPRHVSSPACRAPVPARDRPRGGGAHAFQRRAGPALRPGPADGPGEPPHAGRLPGPRVREAAAARPAHRGAAVRCGPLQGLQRPLRAPGRRHLPQAAWPTCSPASCGGSTTSSPGTAARSSSSCCPRRIARARSASPKRHARRCARSGSRTNVRTCRPGRHAERRRGVLQSRRAPLAGGPAPPGRCGACTQPSGPAGTASCVTP